MLRVLAVDLGATSARVCAVDLDAVPLAVEVLHRVAHEPERDPAGALRWDWPALMAAVEHGLERGLATGPVASIGVCTWGVDYGLLDAGGRLLASPHSYRSDRTARWEAVADRIGRERLYRTTGIQLMGINTVFQLASHAPDELERASTVVLLPELVVHHLTGAVHAERTSAGTTALVDVVTGTWSTELLDALGLDPSLFPTISPPGTTAGTWRDIPVQLVAGHDTASAMATAPGRPRDGQVIVSSGSWLLVGTERPQPDTSTAAAAANFSNEPGAFGGVRFLKNVMGLAMIEQSRAAWGNPSVAAIADAAAAVPPGPVVDATDARFVAPSSMDDEVRRMAGLEQADWPVVARCIFDSLAAGVGRVVGELAAFGPAPTEVAVVGGGTKLPLVLELIGQACDLPVVAGPAEATSIGNAMIQGIALGRIEH